MIDAPSSSSHASFDRSGDTPLDRLLLSLTRRGGGGEMSFSRPTAPWSLDRHGSTIDLRLTQSREEDVADPANRELLMACGGVIEDVRIAANRQGRALDVRAFPDARDAGWIARLSIEGCVAPRLEDEALYGLLVPRSRVRPVGGGRLMSPALIAVLRHAARSANGWIDVIADDTRRELLADLELEAAIIADAERGARRLVTRRDVAHHRTPREPMLVRGGGGPGLEELFATLGGRITPRHDWCSGLASRVRSDAIEAPLLIVLGTKGDTPSDWLAAGSALQRVVLHATVQGLGATFMNGPVHNPLVRHALRSLLFAGDAPQAIMRFEFDDEGGHEAVATSRREAPRT